MNLREGGEGYKPLIHWSKLKPNTDLSVIYKKIGDKNRGRKFSKETIQKMSESHKRCNLSDETIQKFRKASLGRKFSEETKRRLSDSHKGKKCYEETKQKISIANKGNYHTKNTKLLISVNTKIGMRKPEVKDKLGSGIRNKHRVYDNPEHTKWHFE